MGKVTLIVKHLADLPEGAIMSDACAKTIASLADRTQPHLRMFAITGRITSGTFQDFVKDLAAYRAAGNGDRVIGGILSHFGAYLAHHGTQGRGHVRNWSALSL